MNNMFILKIFVKILDFLKEIMFVDVRIYTCAP